MVLNVQTVTCNLVDTNIYVLLFTVTAVTSNLVTLQQCQNLSYLISKMNIIPSYFSVLF